jgi:hypothetical protein
LVFFGAMWSDALVCRVMSGCAVEEWDELRPGGDWQKSAADRRFECPRQCSQGRSAGPLEGKIAFRAVKVRPRTPGRGSVGVALSQCGRQNIVHNERLLHQRPRAMRGPRVKTFSNKFSVR